MQIAQTPEIPKLMWENGRASSSSLAVGKIEQKLQLMGEEGADLLERYFGTQSK